MSYPLHIAEGLSLPIDMATQTMLVVGKRGSGKSNTCVRLAEQFYKAKVPFVAVDPTDTWFGLKSSKDGKGPGLSVVIFGGRHADLPLEPSSGAMVADVVIDHRISAVLSIKHFSGRDRGRFVSDFADRLFRRNTEPLHIFLEEAHEVAPQQPFKGEEEMLGRVTRIWKLGRSSGLGGSAITQRPASLSKNITTQAEILIVHRMLGPQDVAAVREWIKYHGESDEVLSQLSELKTGEAWLWAPDFPEGKPIGLRRVKILERETFNSSATPKAGERQAEPKTLAQVDLDALRVKMAATIERAKAEDPRELRRRIAVLEGELRKAKAAPAVVHPGPEEITKIRDAALWEIQKKLVAPLEQLEKEAMIISSVGEQLLHLYKEFWKGMPFQPVGILSAHPSPLKHSGQIARKPENPIPLEKHRAPEPPRTSTPSSLGESGLKRMLIALAQRNGLSARQLGLRAGLSSKSGTFSTYLGRARSSGWINGSKDRIEITEAGRAAIGSHNPLPEGRDLLDYWLGQLGNSGAARMLRVLAERYPRPTTAEDLGEAAELSAGSGTFSTYLGRLRTLELITGSKSDLRASEELF